MFAIVGAVISGLAGYHLATGIPLWQGTSKFSGGEHIASSGELWFGAIGGLPILIFGLVVLLSTLNCAVTIDETGISATNLIKRTWFQATWADVTALDRIEPRPGSGYKLIANGKILKLQFSASDMRDLVAEIKRRAPNLPKT